MIRREQPALHAEPHHRGGGRGGNEAARNNVRPATRAFAARMLELIDGEPEYHHFDEIYRTDR